MGSTCCSRDETAAATPCLVRAVKLGRATIELIHGDITEYSTDVVINATNARLQHADSTSQ
jgi:hypothetical protein